MTRLMEDCYGLMGLKVTWTDLNFFFSFSFSFFFGGGGGGGGGRGGSNCFII